MPFVRWPSITNFHNVRRAVKDYPPLTKGKDLVTYRGKVKLHGTNAALVFDSSIPNGGWEPQSRTTTLTEGMDNQGFATWARSHREALDSCGYLNGTAFFGEWAGPGVNKGCAVHQIENKIFAVFAALQTVDETLPENERSLDLIVEPSVLEALLAPLKRKIDNIYVLPWHGPYIEVDWSLSSEDLKDTIDFINEEVAKVEACDPWVKSVFGIKGTGEGIVYYPVGHLNHLGRDNFSNLGFKAKGEKHKVVKTKRPVQVDPEKVASIAEFVDLVVTEARLEQGLQEACQGVIDIKRVGSFIGWVGKDVNKECQDELIASQLEWKDVSKPVATKAREWYQKKLES